MNKAGLELVKEFEGLRLEAYLDPVGVWTIGYGHTSMAGPPEVKKGMKLTSKEAEDLLLRDLKKYEDAVDRLVKVDLNDNQHAALSSFTYNLGEGNLKKSTLLKKLNDGDYSGASAEFPKWNKAGGKILKGLTRRREAERALFDTRTTVQKEEPSKSTPTPTEAKKPSTGLLEMIIRILIDVVRSFKAR